jgi:hypothetical protein
MFKQLLPQRVDNTYRGHKLALGFFAVLVLMKAGISLGCIFNGYTAASSGDGIPLDTYTLACAQTVVSDFAIWGLSELMICVLCILVFVRYRAMVPFMFALLLLEHLSKKLILHFLPVAKTGTPPGSTVSLVLLALTIVGLALSLWRREQSSQQV